MAETLREVEAECTLVRKPFADIKRRETERFRCLIATLGDLTVPQNGTQVKVWVNNFSVTGVAFIVVDPLAIGTEVVIYLKEVDHTAKFRKAARVANATQLFDGSWRLGCEFHSPLSGDELDSLM